MVGNAFESLLPKGTQKEYLDQVLRVLGYLPPPNPTGHDDAKPLTSPPCIRHLSLTYQFQAPQMVQQGIGFLSGSQSLGVLQHLFQAATLFGYLLGLWHS